MGLMNSELRRQAIAAGMVAFLWTAGVAASLYWNKTVQDQETESFALIEADAVLFKDILFRKWMTLKDNVYAPVSAITVPNPYLEVPYRDVIIPPGRKFTLINPAFMTREVHELQNAERLILGHITSLKPIRPGNAPDSWEAETLRAFEKGAKEASTRQVISGALYFRHMKPLITDASCMQCHAKQGYTPGNVRGGISVSVPMAPLMEASRRHLFAIASAHAGIWLIGLVVIGAWFRISRAHLAQRLRHEEELLVKDTAIATSSSAVVLTDLAGSITYANDMFHRMTRIDAADPVTGKSLFELLHIPNAQEILSQILELEKWFAELSASRRDGTEFFILLSAALIISDRNEKVGISFSIIDISMRKSAEMALKESRESLRQRNETMEKDLEIAELVQRDLISMKVPKSGFLDIAFTYLPMEKVGGDFFSFHPAREDSLGVFIGDVTGHGVAAALFHSLIRSATEKIGRDHSISPSEFIFRLNNELAGNMTSYFITAVYCTFSRLPSSSSVAFTYSNGGHPSPVIVRKSGETGFCTARGTVIGQIRDYRYAEETVLLNPGDSVFLLTDGLPETENARKEMIGYEDGLAELLGASIADTAGKTVDEVIRRLNAFRGSVPFQDDILLVGIRVKE